MSDTKRTLPGALKSYALTNSNGISVEVANYGARIISLLVPDKNGKLADVVLGYDSLEEYLKGNLYFGVTIGRYSNRIAKGKFSLNGKEYQLAKNNEENSLHGGVNTFHNAFWETISSDDASVTFGYLSPDGEEGFPGNLNVSLRYSLTNDNEIIIEYKATTDQETVISLTHHSFFNLAGAGHGDVLDHEILINADKFIPVDETLIPFGELRNVKGTPFDFRTPFKIGQRINNNDEQLKFGIGYDHTYVLNKMGNELSLAATVKEPASGRVMEVLTTEPGLQFYSGNFLDGSDVGKQGKSYASRSAFCLEAQHFPDSPNQPRFPTTVLKLGEVYAQKTIYKFPRN